MLARLLLLHTQLAGLTEVNLGKVTLQTEEHSSLSRLNIFAVDVHLLGAILQRKGAEVFYDDVFSTKSQERGEDKFIIHLESGTKADVTALYDVQLQLLGGTLLAQLVAVVAKTLVHAPLSRLNISAESADVGVASLLKNSVGANVVCHDFLHDENFLLARLQKSNLVVRMRGRGKKDKKKGKKVG